METVNENKTSDVSTQTEPEIEVGKDSDSDSDEENEEEKEKSHMENLQVRLDMARGQVDKKALILSRREEAQDFRFFLVPIQHLFRNVDDKDLLALGRNPSDELIDYELGADLIACIYRKEYRVLRRDVPRLDPGEIALYLDWSQTSFV